MRGEVVGGALLCLSLSVVTENIGSRLSAGTLSVTTCLAVISAVFPLRGPVNTTQPGIPRAMRQTH